MNPMQTAIATAIAKMGMMKFFPADAHTKASIGQEIASMATEPAQVYWLADNMVRHFNEWPGPIALRAAFCQRFPPADGVSRDMQGFSGSWEAEIEDKTITAHEETKRLGAGNGAPLLLESGLPEAVSLSIVEQRAAHRRQEQSKRWSALCIKRPALARNLPNLVKEFRDTQDLDRRDVILKSLGGAELFRGRRDVQ